MPATLTPYLGFPGTTREAFAFYEKALGARIAAMMSYDDMPKSDTPPAAGCDGSGSIHGNDIMHASLALPGGAMLFAGDTPPGQPRDGIKGVMLALQLDTVEEARRVFDALSQGGQVTMPLAPTFWARTFGMVTDRFGVAWGIGGEAVNLQ